MMYNRDCCTGGEDRCSSGGGQGEKGGAPDIGGLCGTPHQHGQHHHALSTMRGLCLRHRTGSIPCLTSTRCPTLFSPFHCAEPHFCMELVFPLKLPLWLPRHADGSLLMPPLLLTPCWCPYCCWSPAHAPITACVFNTANVLLMHHAHYDVPPFYFHCQDIGFPSLLMSLVFPTVAEIN